MDDGHEEAQSQEGVKTFMSQPSQHVGLKEWSVHRPGNHYEHLKRSSGWETNFSYGSANLPYIRTLVKILDETGSKDVQTFLVVPTDSDVEHATELSETSETLSWWCWPLLLHRTSKTQFDSSARKWRSHQHLTCKTCHGTPVPILDEHYSLPQHAVVTWLHQRSVCSQ